MALAVNKNEAVCCPSLCCDLELGDIDFSEHLAKYRDHEVVIVIASVGKAARLSAGSASAASAALSSRSWANSWSMSAFAWVNLFPLFWSWSK